MKYFKYSLPLLFIIAVELLVKFSHNSICLWKLLTGHECWGCGITRAFDALFHLRFHQAFEFNHFIIVIAPLMLLLWVKLILSDDTKI